MGAPNVDEFAPSSHSIIKVTDFKFALLKNFNTYIFRSPKELAEYLIYLDTHDEEYQKYLEWKRVGPSEQFKQLLARQELDARCRLCIKAAQVAAESHKNL
jgi:hypothetical protein